MYLRECVFVREFVFVLEFNRKRDVPQLTHISIHKRDCRQDIHQTGLRLELNMIIG